MVKYRKKIELSRNTNILIDNSTLDIGNNNQDNFCDDKRVEINMSIDEKNSYIFDIGNDDQNDVCNKKVEIFYDPNKVS